MGKVGNYIVGASVVAVMAGSPVSAEAQENVTNNNENGNKIEYVQDNLRDELKNDSTVAWETVAGNAEQLSEASSTTQTKEELKEELKLDAKEKDELVNLLKAPTRTVEYQVDTVNYVTGTLARYSPLDNTITVYYRDVGEEHKKSNERAQSSGVVVHEVQHKDKKLALLGKMSMSCEQNYKLCMHDEISSNIADLLDLRQKYIEAKTDEERDSVLNGADERFSYYVDAIRSNKIKPGSLNSKDFKEEMAFIANETKNMWVNKYAIAYASHNIYITSDHANNGAEYCKENNENYKNAMDTMYTMGGINFSEYFKEDVECYDKEGVAKEQAKADSLKKKMPEISTYEADMMKIEMEPLKGTEGLSAEQQYNLAIHKYMAKHLLEGGIGGPISNFFVKNELQYVDYFAKEKWREVSRDNNLFNMSVELQQKILKENTYSSKGNEEKYQQMLKDIWVIDGIDFTKGFKDGKVPDFNNDPELDYFASVYSLNYQISERSFSNRVKNCFNRIKSKFKKEDSYSDVKIEAKDPKYMEGRGFSDVLTRSDIIDFRKPFLKDFLSKLEEVEGAKGNVATNANNSVVENSPALENNVSKQDRVAGDVVRGEQTADKTKVLGDKLKEDLANIHPKTEKANDNAMTNVAINMAMQQKGGR
ncbi:MAG: hypothetical protein IJZ30_04170 [Alphaproteobacteria bacterium]|nr:hypothetical protein [Alphaproteobacteria bacterium]